MLKNLSDLKTKHDLANMFDAINGFSIQIQDSVNQMKNWTPDNKPIDVRNILILGMGGSAIGGDIARVVLQNECDVPILVNRSYNIPAWVNGHTLVIASSYSGNTEETLSGLDQCIARRAQIIAMTTGGRVGGIAVENSFDVIPMVPGLQPRAALGYSFTLLLMALIKLEFGKADLVNQLENAVIKLDSISESLNKFDDDNYAIKVSKKIYESIPVIYGSEDLTWVAALRFRGQLAENSKMMAFHHHIPEHNHNEIEGWNSYPELLKKLVIIWLPDQQDHKRSLARMKISRELLSDLPSSQINITADGNSPLVRLLLLIHTIDWISYYTALLNETDPTPVNRIMSLKDEMSKIL